MKNLFTLLFAFLLFSATSLAQEESKSQCCATACCALMKNFTASFALGTDAASVNSFRFNDLGGVTIGELTLAYKINPRLSFGLGTYGTLHNINSGYYNAEGEFFEFSERWDDDDHLDGKGDDDDDDRSRLHPRQHAPKNLLAYGSYKVSDNLPFFLQVGFGYSINYDAAAWFGKIGYSQPIWGSLGAHFGVRFSDVLHQLPDEAIRANSSAAVRAELGINWNF